MLFPVRFSFYLNFFDSSHTLPLRSLCSCLSTPFIYSFISVALPRFSWQAGAAPLWASPAAGTVRGRKLRGHRSPDRFVLLHQWPRLRHLWAGPGCWALLASWHGRENQFQAYFHKTKWSHLPSNHCRRHKYPACKHLLLEEEWIFFCFLSFWNQVMKCICCIFTLPVAIPWFFSSVH